MFQQHQPTIKNEVLTSVRDLTSVHPQGGFALFEFADESKSDPGVIGEIDLRPFDGAALLFYEFAEIHLYLLGYKFE